MTEIFMIEILLCSRWILAAEDLTYQQLRDPHNMQNFILLLVQKDNNVRNRPKLSEGFQKPYSSKETSGKPINIHPINILLKLIVNFVILSTLIILKY